MKRSGGIVLLLLLLATICPAQEKLSAIVFLAVDCPISQKYTAELNKIDSLYGNQVSLSGIVPGKITPEELQLFRSEYRLRFPVEADPDYSVVKRFTAVTTPEIFLSAGSKLIYRGAIDNWFFDLGSYRQQITQYYFLEALQAYSQSKPVQTSRTEAVGCPIQIPKRWQ